MTSAPSNDDTPRPIGVYVHFPYCLKKCPYCDFVSFAAKRDEIDHEGYASRVIDELSLRRDDLRERSIATVFFGGGTPSLWDPKALGRVLRAVLDAGLSVAENVEITAECNPTSIDTERAKALHDQGVNRLSIGVQGLDTARLQHLGRLHDADGGLRALEAVVRSGMPRVSADLIYGVALHDPDAPGGSRTQTADEARAEVLRVASTGITHLSAYALTIEPGTGFGELSRKGRLPLASEDAVADTFLAVDEALAEVGLAHYEVSNFARPGDESQHNLGYWRGRDYLGLGTGAFGTVTRGGGEALRTRNHPEPRTWSACVAKGQLPEESREPLDGETRLRERIMLGLRLAEGLDLKAAAEELGVAGWTVERERAAQKLVARGRLRIEGHRLRVPRDAWLFADGAAAELM